MADLPPPPVGGNAPSQRGKVPRRRRFRKTLVVVAGAVVVLVVLAVIFGDEDTDSDQTPSTATPVVTPRSTIAPAPTAAPAPTRPSYCRHYDDWAASTAIADRLERKNGDDASTWPARDLDEWFEAIEDRGAAANRLWDTAPEDFIWDDVRRVCG